VQIVHETISKKAHHKKGLVEWLKEKALSSNPSTAKKKKNEEVGVVHAFGQEVEKGRSPSEDSPGKSMRPYLKR
jgi:hypothetical protein